MVGSLCPAQLAAPPPKPRRPIHDPPLLPLLQRAWPRPRGHGPRHAGPRGRTAHGGAGAAWRPWIVRMDLELCLVTYILLLCVCGLLQPAGRPSDAQLVSPLRRFVSAVAPVGRVRAAGPGQCGQLYRPQLSATCLRCAVRRCTVYSVQYSAPRAAPRCTPLPSPRFLPLWSPGPRPGRARHSAGVALTAPPLPPLMPTTTPYWPLATLHCQAKLRSFADFPPLLKRNTTLKAHLDVLIMG